MTGDAGRARVVLADDHPVVLAGVHGLLTASGAFEVVANLANGEAALSHIRDLAPQIAVLDINMPRLTGLDVLRAVRDEGLSTRIVLLTASVDDEQILHAVNNGAWGVVLKDAAGDELVECLTEVAAGRRWLPADIIAPALRRQEERGEVDEKIDAALTAREREIAGLVARGLSNKHISRTTGIAEGTVKIHLHNIYQKLNLANRTALATFAQRRLSANIG